MLTMVDELREPSRCLGRGTNQPLNLRRAARCLSVQADSAEIVAFFG
jgi:hypothetical protein